MNVAHSVADLSEVELSALEDCLYSADFLRFVEEEHGGRSSPFYFSLRDEDGRLTAFTVGYEHTAAIPFTFNLSAVLGEDPGRRLEANLRVLKVYVPYRLKSRIFGDPVHQAEVLRDLTDWAGSNGYDCVVFPFVWRSDEELCRLLGRAGYTGGFYEGDFFLPLPAETQLEDFLRSMPREPRKQLRNDMNRLERSSYLVHDAVTIHGNEQSLADLHLTLLAKYGRGDEPELSASSLSRLERLVGRRKILVARDEDGTLASFSVSVYGDDTFHLLRYGRAAHVDESARLYGNLVFVEPIRAALALGTSRIHFGKASHRAKTLRGCEFEEGHTYAVGLTDAGQELPRILSDAGSRNELRFRDAVRGRH